MQFGISFQLCRAWVHGAIHVGVHVNRLHLVGRPQRLQPSALVLHDASRVCALQPHVRPVHVDPVPGLVAQGPKQNAWMVPISLHHALSASHVSFAPGLIICQRVLRQEANAVALNVGLVDHIEAILIAQHVPKGVVWVVGAPHSVEVVRLHHLYICNHRLATDHVSCPCVMLNPIYSSNCELPSVEHHSTVSNLDCSKANCQCDRLCNTCAGLR
mmetsp:Transcript_91823/g.231705  ORF Transcript_91823/g.231705 Transcript_91823/m.231705 type:complete len:215 (+) Transcript_91823:804-1448(+)